MRKNCSSDREKLLKFQAEGREFSKILRSLEQFFLTVGQNNFGNKMPFLPIHTCIEGPFFRTKSMNKIYSFSTDATKQTTVSWKKKGTIFDYRKI